MSFTKRNMNLYTYINQTMNIHLKRYEHAHGCRTYVAPYTEKVYISSISVHIYD